MPTYEYECSDCAHQFEELQSMSAPPLQICPSCGKASLRRLVGGGVGIIFKGSGFYVNDSKKASKSTASTTPPKTSTEAAASTATGSSATGSADGAKKAATA